VRGFLHGKLRQELIRNPNTVIFTGHSLGGALATFAALDVSIHTIPRVNAYLKHHAKYVYRLACALYSNYHYVITFYIECSFCKNVDYV
jgi:hypothetical protein